MDALFQPPVAGGQPQPHWLSEAIPADQIYTSYTQARAMALKVLEGVKAGHDFTNWQHPALTVEQGRRSAQFQNSSFTTRIGVTVSYDDSSQEVGLTIRREQRPGAIKTNPVVHETRIRPTDFQSTVNNGRMVMDSNLRLRPINGRVTTPAVNPTEFPLDQNGLLEHLRVLKDSEKFIVRAEPPKQSRIRTLINKLHHRAD